MAIHFLTTTAVVACGKTNVGEVSEKPQEVTCKNCLRSQAFTQRDAVAEQVVSTPVPAAVAESAPTPNKPVATKPALSVVLPAGSGKTANMPKTKAVDKANKGVAFAEWRERFGEKDRLPRGKAFASM